MRIVTVTEQLDAHRRTTNGVRVSRALEKLGHEVSIVNNGGLTPEKLSGAELVLIFGTIFTAFSPRTTRGKNVGLHYMNHIAKNKNPGTVLALWYFDMCAPETKHAPWKFQAISDSAGIVDWLFTTDHSYPWETVARNYRWLMQGVAPADFELAPPPPAPRRYDVVFTGGARPPFEYRQKYLDALRREFDVMAYGRGYNKRVFGARFVEAYHKSKLALVPPPPPQAPHHYWSNRLYLAAATGTPCLVGYAAGLEDHYEDGKEVAYFRNTDELMVKARELVRDPERRKAMGDAARYRTLTEHTYEERCRTLMETIFPGETTQ